MIFQSTSAFNIQYLDFMHDSERNWLYRHVRCHNHIPYEWWTMSTGHRSITYQRPNFCRLIFHRRTIVNVSVVCEENHHVPREWSICIVNIVIIAKESIHNQTWGILHGCVHNLYPNIFHFAVYYLAWMWPFWARVHIAKVGVWNSFPSFPLPSVARSVSFYTSTSHFSLSLVLWMRHVLCAPQDMCNMNINF